MIQKLKSIIEKNELFSLNDLLILAVSGGRDSIAMFHSLKSLKYNFVVAHCNFNLRGNESDGDELFVKLLCDQFKVAFYSESFDTKSYANSKGISIQMAARELRYDWFASLKNELSANYVLTAHHLDDQIESFLINLTRGSGLKGLTGIEKKKDFIVRPILDFSRKEINDYITLNKIPFREDQSNKDDKYLRNRFRHKVLPELSLANPSFNSSFKRTIEYLKSVDEYWTYQFGKWKEEYYNKGVLSIALKDVFLVNNKSFFSYHLSECGFSKEVLDNILDEKKDFLVGSKFLSHTHVLIRDRKNWELEKRIEHDDILFGINDLNMPVKLQVEVFNISQSSVEIPKENHIVIIDSAKVFGELYIRKWKEGDWFVPFGMLGRKKLSDFFIDNKISRLDKEKIWLLCDEKNIIWLLGLRLDNRYRLDENTKEILKIEFTNE